MCDGGKAALYSFQKRSIILKTFAKIVNNLFLILGTIKRPSHFLGFPERNEGVHKCADWKQEFQIENWG